MKAFSGLLVCLFLLGAFPARADESLKAVALRPPAEVGRAAIRLSDVFANVPEGIDGDIAAAPAPGKSVTYNARILGGLAEKYRLDWRPQSLADKIVLTRASQRITQDMIRDAIVEKLKEKNINGKAEIQFDNRHLGVNLPMESSPEFELSNFDIDPAGKRFRTDLVAMAGASPVVLAVTGRITLYRDIPVLARRLPSGTAVSEADVTWTAFPEDRLAPDAVVDSSQMVGRALRRDTAEGTPLHSRDLMEPRLVARGKLVILKIQNPHLLITAQGRALQDGGIGDTVTVTNTQSNRVVSGVVESPGVVRIQTAQKVASIDQEKGRP